MTDTNLIFKNQLIVNSFECDINRQWKPASFFQHLTETAGRHADQLGCGFETMFARNLFWVHSRMKIQFYRFPVDGEKITITTWPKTIQQKLFFIRDYQIHSEKDELLAAASSAWLIIDASSRRMVPPASTNLNLPTYTDRVALDEPLEKLSVGDGGEPCLNITAGYSAVDMQGHVNNSRYVEWVCDSFPMEEFQTHTLDWMQVNYDNEIRPGEMVTITRHNPDGDAGIWAISGHNESNDTRAFEALLRWKN